MYVGGEKVLSHDYLKQLTPLSLAIWYMDDGSFTLRAKGLQARTRDGSGGREICVEAMEPDHPSAPGRATSPTRGASRRSSLSAGPARRLF